MIINYDINMPDSVMIKKYSMMTNQIYKLLPLREEESDWESLLSTLRVETAGLCKLLVDETQLLSSFTLLCKLEGLTTLTDKEDFPDYRKTIFECIGLVGKLKEYV